ncbi:MAG TPA: DUF3105 domain-containing protein [Actinomycetota bacterium]|nr:DUF3105 domain-containing protein [Actinomycetota bacterium]
MAKKKRKKGRRPARPATATAAPAAGRRETAAAEERPDGPAKPATAAAVSNRQARKEQARRDRERRIRRARRRERMRRIVRWGAVIAVVAAIVGAIVYVNTRPLRLENAAAAEAAAALGCGGGEGNIQEPANQGREHLQQGQLPPEYTSTPGTSGPHSISPYAGEPVIEQPVDPVLEAQLVHNLEHAYVIMYYRQSGENALPDEVVEALANVAGGETKVLLAPYPDLPEGTALSFAAWTKLLECPAIEADEADQAVQVARGFIDQYRGTANAPEPQAG